MDQHLDEMLKHDVVRPSKSPWGSVPVFVKKKNGKWRMALDYRPLNKQMVRDAYPLPLIWDELQQAANHLWYTSLDLQWGFWNVPLAEECKAYTAIVMYRGTFEFNVIPFGIKNSPGEFQRAMDWLFSCLREAGVLCYIDDIIIFEGSWERHLCLLDKVLEISEKGGVYLNLEKGQYGHHCWVIVLASA